tara:strand:- start:423 stop:887 length:465 start_codon:yes stop_codon:yes gene_type:complete
LVGYNAGEVEADMGFEKLNSTFEMAEWDDNLIQLFGGTGIAATQLRFTGSVEKDDDSTTARAIEMIYRGRITVLDFGDLERGSLSPLKCECSLAYFKYSSNGKAIIELDPLNNIDAINGVDRLAARRGALGQDSASSAIDKVKKAAISKIAEKF